MFLTNMMVEKASLEEIKIEIRAIVEEVISSSLENIKWNDNRLLKRQEVSELLGVSLVTLNKWNKLGVLPAFSIGTRVYYYWEDVQNAMKRIV